MKNVIWGTGLYACEFAYAMRSRGEIAFFIDNNKDKQGKLFMGKKIMSPDDVEDWNDLYLYIPYNYYDEIVEQLKVYGLTDETHFQKYDQINKIGSAACKTDYEAAIAMLRSMAEKMKGYCLLWGRAWAFEGKGYKEYIHEWKNNDRNLKLGLVSEAIWYSKEETEEIMGLPAIVTSGIFDEHIYVENGMLEKEQLSFLTEKKYARSGAECLRVKFPFLTEAEADYMIYYMYQYVINVLDILQPETIIAYPLLMVQHRILEEVCIEKGIPLISTHQGIIPGTLVFDIGGEMGKSLPAVYFSKFRELSVEKEELEYSKKVWDYLYTSKLNRKIQQQNDCVEYVLRNIDKKRPIIMFAGQYDANSNMVPYTDETKEYHSPIFHTSIEAGIYMAELCNKNGWNFVYKPHPMNTKFEDKGQLPDNTIYVEFGNINDLIDTSDVVVTILSQTNYVALIRHKPVVMLGYNQTRGKGCTYEAFEKNRIQSAVKEALENGFTKEQEEAFLKHIAQVLKYYLFDDLQERELRFGLKAPFGIEEFYGLKKLLTESEKSK